MNRRAVENCQRMESLSRNEGETRSLKERSMKSTTPPLAIALSLIMSAITAIAAPTPKYTVTDIGILPGYLSTVGNSIDSLGEVAGWCDANGTAVTHAFVYRAGKLIDFGALYNPTLQTKAYFTIIKGEVALSYALPINSGEYTVLYQNGHFTTLSFPEGGHGYVAGLNDSGQIAGNYNVNGITPAYLIEANGNVITLPTFGTVFGNCGFKALPNTINQKLAPRLRMG